MEKLTSALKAYDNNILSGFKSYGTLALLAAITYVLPETKLTSFVELASYVHLFALTVAKKS